MKFLLALLPFVSSAVKTIRANASTATLAATAECQGSVIAGAKACGGGVVSGFRLQQQICDWAKKMPVCAVLPLLIYLWPFCLT